MTISITEKEYKAIKDMLKDMLNQVTTDYQYASNKSHLESTDKTIALVSNVIKKYKIEKEKAHLFSSVRAEIVQKYKNKGLTENEIHKMANQKIRAMREGGKQ